VASKHARQAEDRRPAGTCRSGVNVLVRRGSPRLGAGCFWSGGHGRGPAGRPRAL